MYIDGKKVACATCIKGHRATHCKHKDRPLVEIKKIGRPSTQCGRCRGLRLLRQLHLKCDCDDDDERPPKRTQSVADDAYRKKRLIASLRTIAPRQPVSQPASCCRSTLSTKPKVISQNTSSCGSPSNICPSSTTKNALGRPVRLVNCRCGDDCTCIGCDAHPSRAMKSSSQPDPYAGYLDFERRRQPQQPPSPSLSSSSNTSSPLLDDRPTSVLTENGASLCGCGCNHAPDQSTGCFQDYFTSR